MRNFDFEKEYSKLLTPDIVSYITQIHEYRGRYSTDNVQKELLSELLEIARIQSTEASNRIEGIITTDDRLKKIVREKTLPKTRSEKKLPDTGMFWQRFMKNYEYIPVSSNMILQLHRDLYKFSGNGYGGNFKSVDNVIAEELPDGTKRVRFQPVPAWETAETVNDLCNAFKDAVNKQFMDILLLLPMFILNFLCIHPFNDGNGRMSRLLTLLILYKSEYYVGQYISIERLISDTKENYYEALQESSWEWYEGRNDYAPFVKYMLGIIVAAYREFADRVEILTDKTISKSDRIGEIIRNSYGRITKAEIVAQCPEISQTTIQRTLNELLKNNQIIKIGGEDILLMSGTGRTNDMVTGELKSKIDNLWEIFWTGGLTNPLDVVEQMTYLMFIRDLDDADNVHAKEAAMLGLPHKSIFAGEIQIGDRKIDGSQLKWSTFHDFPAAKMYSTMQEWVFPFIKNLHGDKESAYSKYMGDAIFKVPTPLMLDKIVTTMDAIYEQMEQIKSADTRGDVYEYLLSKLATAGVNGQFRTPRHIIRMMVEMMDPKADEIICDPACGTSGFLVAASEYLRDRKKQEVLFDRQNKEHYMNHMFHGYDMDRTMLRIGAMNMMTHGVENPYIEYRDSLSDQNTDKEKYSLILANPPFKGSLDYDIVSADLLKVCKTKKTELLFLALFIRMLKIGGRCACIVPDGVLFGSSTAHKAIRKALVEENRLEAVISMPSGVFKPYAGVSTAILIFTKTGHGGTDKVWFYDMKADGFSLDDKRTETKENDIPDIIERFRNLDKETDRKRTDQSFFVPKEEIAENGYDLSINKYKEIEYVPVEYPSTQEIMTELHEIEMKIGEEMQALEELLGIN